jgi:pimeloyl-ACP methyl ester carboxylesterase
VPAISLNKAPDPLFLIAGGPGTSAVDMYTSTSAPFDRVRRDRDIVLLDQRGTGRSHRLDCKYDNQNEFQRIEDIEVGPENVKCRDELSKTSDLRFYTTSIAVKDLDAVRLALGYERINLLGTSYGTRVAQHYARRYPKSTRTLILDGVVNPEQVLVPRLRPTPNGADAHPGALQGGRHVRKGIRRSVCRIIAACANDWRTTRAGNRGRCCHGSAHPF